MADSYLTVADHLSKPQATHGFNIAATLQAQAQDEKDMGKDQSNVTTSRNLNSSNTIMSNSANSSFSTSTQAHSNVARNSFLLAPQFYGNSSGDTLNGSPTTASNIFVTKSSHFKPSGPDSSSSYTNGSRFQFQDTLQGHALYARNMHDFDMHKQLKDLKSSTGNNIFLTGAKNSQANNERYNYSSSHNYLKKSEENQVNASLMQVEKMQILSLQNEVKRLRLLQTVRNNNPQLFLGKDSSANLTISPQINTIFQKVMAKLAAKEKELEETKTRLEAVLTAIALNPSKSVTKYGQYDEQEVAHRILVRLETLTNENEQMGKMLSFGKSKEKDIEIGLLQHENQILKERVNVLEKSLSDSLLAKTSSKKSLKESLKEDN